MLQRRTQLKAAPRGRGAASQGILTTMGEATVTKFCPPAEFRFALYPAKRQQKRIKP
jgi:hypothetical protein